jgi:hypothetical protein
MGKNILLFVIIFLVFPLIVSPFSNFFIEETEKISLVPYANDPDDDNLIIDYSSPLDENGEWQTDYGDAGEYEVTITVSDGQSSVSEDVLITVLKKEVPPKIESYTPREDKVIIDEGDLVMFTVSAIDQNNDEIMYSWYLDGKQASIGDYFTFNADFRDSGSYRVMVKISDKTSTVTKEWKLIVNNMDVEGLLGSVKDIEVNENEIAILELLDFEEYGLTYTISEPLGNQNSWQTSNDDSGTYEVRISAKGNGFSGEKKVLVHVKNVDRIAEFEELENKIIEEDEEIIIELNANDPDGDEIIFLANDLPDGAIFENNTFRWKPSFDTVQKENFIDYFTEKFSPLKETFFIQFIATSNNLSKVQNLAITVIEKNRAPVIEDMETIEVTEGDVIELNPNAYDPDFDRFYLTYSGFMTSDILRTQIGDFGNHTITVKASDGKLDSYKEVILVVNKLNREPIFRPLGKLKVYEGDEIAILLDARDPDGDRLELSVENPKNYSSLVDNAYYWTPPDDFITDSKSKNVDIVFSASDGEFVVKRAAHVQVKNKNKAPKILQATTSVTTKVNQPVSMSVEAYDPDGDKLTYEWEFGIFEAYESSNMHKRVFTSPGTKIVKVKVSDGFDTVKQVIYVHVAGDEGGKTSKKQVKVTKESDTKFYKVIVPPNDGKLITSSNQPPVITDGSKNLVAKVNEPILLFVKASDSDKDVLTYTWDFGMFESYTATSNHKRTFISRGDKTVVVTVSDGLHSVQHTINVRIV